jgi:IPT/TIG domain
MVADPVEENVPGPGPGDGAVPALMIVLLAFYLVIVASLLLWGIYQRWPACDAVCVNQAAVSPTPSATPTATPSPTTLPGPSPSPTPPSPPPASPPAQPTTTDAITIEAVSPKSGLMDCSMVVTIKGKGFKQGASVIFGGVPAKVVATDPNGQFISVNPPARPAGEVDLVVRNPDGASSDIAKAAFTYACPLTSEADLFLLVVFAGALGGALHGLRSLYWYAGLRSLLKSWTLMYFLLPFTGAIMAVVFYVIIGAGLLPLQSTKNVSLAVITIAILVGLFSQQAAVKLKDIADAFLAKPAPGPPSESRPQGSVPPGETKPGTAKPAITPDSGAVATPVKITGTGMKTVNSVTFGGVEGTNKAVAADGTITVKVPPQTPVPTTPVEVVVTGDKGTVKLLFTYKP